MADDKRLPPGTQRVLANPYADTAADNKVEGPPQMISVHRPVKVRLNRSLFPADLITFQVTRGRSLNGVEISMEFANDALKTRTGDGWPIGRLTSAESIDFFVHGEQRSALEIPGLGLAYPLELRSGRPFLIKVGWTGVDNDGEAGQVLVTWSHDERISGKRPRIAYGDDATALLHYMNNIAQPLGGALFTFVGRVGRMSRRDVAERIQNERKRSALSTDYQEGVWAHELTTRGYRGFREEATLRLAIPNKTLGSGLTIVVGANNAGKSTVWESFDAVARKFKSDISFSEGRRNRQTMDGVKLTIARTDGSRFLVESRNPNTSETKSRWENNQQSPTRLEIVTVPSRRQFQANFSKNNTSERDWMVNGGEYSRQRQPDYQFTGRLFDLHNDESKKSLFDGLMTEVLGHPLDWTIDLAEGQNGASYYLKVTTGDGLNHTSEGLGDGIVSLLYILNALYDSNPNTLLVFDEPELSLHPQLVRRLGETLARHASDRQIVIFTHSPALISWDYIRNGAEIARVYKADGDSRIAQVPRSTIQRVSKARGGWRNPHVLGLDANETFFLDDEIIVVEGQEDAGLLETVFEEVGITARGTVFGWGAGGGDGGPRRIVELLAGLGFRKVVALLDADKADEAAAIQREFPQYLATTIPADDIRDKPARDSKGKSGLLDEKGKSIKPDLKTAATEVLQSVVDFFDNDKPSSGPSGRTTVLDVPPPSDTAAVPS